MPTFMSLAPPVPELQTSASSSLFTVSTWRPYSHLSGHVQMKLPIPSSPSLPPEETATSDAVAQPHVAILTASLTPCIRPSASPVLPSRCGRNLTAPRVLPATSSPATLLSRLVSQLLLMLPCSYFHRAADTVFYKKSQAVSLFC